MNKYVVNSTFFCQALKRYINSGAYIYRSEISSRLIIEGSQDSNNPFNQILSKFEYSDPKQMGWIDELISIESPLISFDTNLPETVNGGNGNGSFSTVNSDYNISESDKFIMATNYINLTLPTPTNGKEIIIINDAGGEGTINIIPNDGENINGSSGTYNFFSGGLYNIKIVSDGTDWWII